MAHFYIELAKKAVENYIKKGEIISPFNDSPKEALTQKSGTFVTIMENGDLRGCIGTYLPTKRNIAEEIIHNAIAAATEDCRFRALCEEELLELSYSVYILNEPEQVKDLKELNPKRYGILVRTALLTAKSGLLLPDLDGINTIEKQISIACQKGGIDPTKERVLIYKFTTQKYQ